MTTSVVHFDQETKKVERVIRAVCARLGYSTTKRARRSFEERLSGKDIYASICMGGGEESVLCSPSFHF